MAEVSSAAAGSTAVQPSMSKPTAEAPAAVDAMLVCPTVPMHMSALSERALVVRTPSPLGQAPASTYVDVDVWGEDDGKPRGVLSKPTYVLLLVLTAKRDTAAVHNCP
jgi:hypothetical protein